MLPAPGTSRWSASTLLLSDKGDRRGGRLLKARTGAEYVEGFLDPPATTVRVDGSNPTPTKTTPSSTTPSAGLRIRKASTSSCSAVSASATAVPPTLIDLMERDGLVGPPDGSKPANSSKPPAGSTKSPPPPTSNFGSQSSPSPPPPAPSFPLLSAERSVVPISSSELTADHWHRSLIQQVMCCCWSSAIILPSFPVSAAWAGRGQTVVGPQSSSTMRGCCTLNARAAGARPPALVSR